MRASELIARFIRELINETGGCVDLQRNELAMRFNVVPSQINYVISSRFTPEQGYIVESQRGGGGYVRIRRINTSKSGAVMHVVNHIGQSMDAVTASIFLENMQENDILTREQARLIAAAVSDKAMPGLSPKQRDVVRASIFKQMLLCTIL